MKLSATLSSFLLAFAFAGPAAASDLLTGLRSLEGDWRGELFYRDFQTDRREEIGQAARVTVSPDAGFVSFELRFTDPGFDVYTLTVLTVDFDTGELFESYHRDRKMELYSFEPVSFQWTDEGFRAVLERVGEDDERPATLRRTLALEGDQLTMRSEVDLLGDQEVAFAFRNESVLTRSDEPISFDHFRFEE